RRPSRRGPTAGPNNGSEGEMNDDLWTLPGPERNPFGGTLGDDGDRAGPAQVASCAGLASSSWALSRKAGAPSICRANVLGPGRTQIPNSSSSPILADTHYLQSTPVAIIYIYIIYIYIYIYIVVVR
ncbi:hypothetical protein THAOC_27296, partial [Thalassiosira oceanica]